MMSSVIQNKNNAEDAGQTLIKTQNDLIKLKEYLIQSGVTDMAPLQATIDQLNEKIQLRADSILEQINGQVISLPDLDDVTFGETIQLFDLMQPRQPNITVSNDRRNLSLPDPSPGQQVKLRHDAKAIANPFSIRNRQILHDEHGVQLPQLVDNKRHQVVEGQVVKGSTIDKLATLPLKHNPQTLPPPVKEEDAKKGLLSLLERRLIPPTAELSFNPSPIKNQTLPIQRSNDVDFGKKQGMEVVPHSSIYKTVSTGVTPVKKEDNNKTSTISNKSHKLVKQQAKKVTPSIKNVELGTFQPQPPPTTPASGEFKETYQKIAIQNGEVRKNTADFNTFKQAYCLNWGPIASLLQRLCKFLKSYKIPMAFVNGNKLVQLAFQVELDGEVTRNQILSLMINRSEIVKLIDQPGQIFQGALDGENKAAAKIQATWKMYKTRTAYLIHRKKKWAAGVIAISWIMTVKMSKVRRQLQLKRLEQLASYKRRLNDISKRWKTIVENRRVIIHINSHGYNSYIRNTIPKININQNFQMARLCDIHDDNVDVIYVSSVQLNEEMNQYYSKLLGLKQAIVNSNVDEQIELSNRYTIVIPEAINSFQSHNFCLSSILKYSPRTIKRIQSLIKGREAYMYTNIPNDDDLDIANALNVPLICSEPKVATLYNTKSGARRILVEAEIPVPPGEFDIYKIPQLFESLSQLIVDNLDINRWLIKINNGIEGSGISFIDINKHLECYEWAIRESIRYGDKWSKRWAQEATLMKIQNELHDILINHIQPATKSIYHDWKTIAMGIQQFGAVIEASPPSESITALTADMMIDPDGTIRLIGVGDQIHDENMYHCWGLSVPQSSIEPQHLNEILNKIAKSCKNKQILGPISIDLVTFIHPKSLQQIIWGVNVSCKYSDTMAMLSLLTFSVNAAFDPINHTLDCPQPPADPKKRKRDQKAEYNTSRYAVLSTRLKHSNLSVVHYSVFFQMCRAHGIGFDVREKQGSIFTLIDTIKRDRLGMLVVSDTLQSALANFARNLNIMHQEISTPSMQGESNFRPVVNDIENILGITIENTSDQVAKTE